MLVIADPDIKLDATITEEPELGAYTLNIAVLTSSRTPWKAIVARHSVSGHLTSSNRPSLIAFSKRLVKQGLQTFGS